MNKGRLFTASCIALIATAMSFAIRGDIMGDFETLFHLNKTNLGWISGAAFWGFGLSIFIGGPLCDRLGMGNIMRLAAAGHIGGTLLTLVAPNFEVLFLATVIIGIANGLVEAAVNPLIATIYSDNKTAKLTALHAWFPGGIVIGGVLAFLFTQIGLGWQAKMLLLLVPSAIYTFLFVGQKFPATEREAAGVPFNDMFKELLRPLFLVIWFSMCLTAVTELGPGQWYANVFNEVMGSTARAGVLVLVWVNGIMYLMRQFAGGISHRVSPILLIATTAISAALGLYLFSHATSTADGLHGGGVPRGRHGVLVADDARHHVGAVPEGRRAGAGGRRWHGQHRDRDCRAGDGRAERSLRPARHARDLGDHSGGADRHLRSDLHARQGCGWLSGGEDRRVGARFDVQRAGGAT